MKINCREIFRHVKRENQGIDYVCATDGAIYVQVGDTFYKLAPTEITSNEFDAAYTEAVGGAK